MSTATTTTSPQRPTAPDGRRPRTRPAPPAASGLPRRVPVRETSGGPVVPVGPVPVRGRGARRLLRSVLVGMAVLALLGTAGWSLVAARAAVPLGAAGPGEVALPGGVAQVDGVLSAARPQHAMPGMGSDEDPVAPGDRRVSVDVTLVAGDAGLRYDVAGFALVADGRTVAPHRSVLPGEELPAGTWLAGTLVFDVPVDAVEGSLSYADGPALALDLPLEGGTGGAGAATSPAPEAPHAGEHG